MKQFPLTRIALLPAFTRLRLWRALLLGSLLALPALAQAQDDEDFFDFDEGTEPAAEIADPLEGLNRACFAFNDKLYRGLLKPVARGLRVLPSGVRTSGKNFFSNLGAPVSAISALLQAEPKNSLTEISRFVVNTTVGILGLFDPASSMGLAQDEEDLGQTLARYGIGHGFYLVLPFYGASSLRDGLGTLGSAAINPVYAQLETGEIIAINITSAEFSLSLDEDTYEAFYDSALDPYIFFRSAWVQNRAGKVAQ